MRAQQATVAVPLLSFQLVVRVSSQEEVIWPAMLAQRAFSARLLVSPLSSSVLLEPTPQEIKPTALNVLKISNANTEMA